MSGQLYSLAYFSENTIEGDDDQIQNEIQNILNVAREKNPKLGLTGALLYSSGYFAQILEGELEPLEDLFETIEDDDRHNGVVVIHYHPVDERSFGAWSMKYAYDPEAALPAIGAADSSDTELAPHFLSVLQSYIKRNESV